MHVQFAHKKTKSHEASWLRGRHRQREATAACEQGPIPSVTSAAVLAMVGKPDGAAPLGRCLWGSARCRRMTSSPRSPQGQLPCGKQAQAGGRGQEDRGGPGPFLNMTVRDLGLHKDSI